jgi:hypothetical protein
MYLWIHWHLKIVFGVNLDNLGRIPGSGFDPGTSEWSAALNIVFFIGGSV